MVSVSTTHARWRIHAHTRTNTHTHTQTQSNFPFVDTCQSQVAESVLVHVYVWCHEEYVTALAQYSCINLSIYQFFCLCLCLSPALCLSACLFRLLISPNVFRIRPSFSRIRPSMSHIDGRMSIYINSVYTFYMCVYISTHNRVVFFETFTHTYRQHDGMDMHAFFVRDGCYIATSCFCLCIASVLRPGCGLCTCRWA